MKIETSHLLKGSMEEV